MCFNVFFGKKNYRIYKIIIFLLYFNIFIHIPLSLLSVKINVTHTSDM